MTRIKTPVARVGFVCQWSLRAAVSEKLRRDAVTASVPRTASDQNGSVGGLVTPIYHTPRHVSVNKGVVRLESLLGAIGPGRVGSMGQKGRGLVLARRSRAPAQVVVSAVSRPIRRCKLHQPIQEPGGECCMCKPMAVHGGMVRHIA